MAEAIEGFDPDTLPITKIGVFYTRLAETSGDFIGVLGAPDSRIFGDLPAAADAGEAALEMIRVGVVEDAETVCVPAIEAQPETYYLREEAEELVAKRAREARPARGGRSARGSCACSPEGPQGGPRPSSPDCCRTR